MYKTVTPREARQLLDEGYVYVDVRSEAEYDEGHVDGARNVPIAHASSMGMQPNPDFVSVMERNFPKDAKLVLGCQAGGRSTRACQMLEAAGFTDLVNMDGGFLGRRDPMGGMAQPGWVQEGFPTSASAGEGCDYESMARKG
jgi:rhodanese-related sulfurtransferase